MQGESLDQYKLSGPLQESLPKGFLVELNQLTNSGCVGGTGFTPDFQSVGAWISQQELLANRSLTTRARDGAAARVAWQDWRKAQKHSISNSKLAAVLSQRWKPYSSPTKVEKAEAQKSKQGTVFDPETSRRCISKMALRLLRAQAEAETKARLIKKQVEQIEISNHANTSLQILIEELRGTIAKLRVDVLGSPKVRSALTAAQEANLRAASSEAELSSVSSLLEEALDKLQQVDMRHEAESQVP